MFANKKSLAHFADAEGRFPDVVLRYLRLFDRHVQWGRLIRRDHINPPNQDRPFALHRILFALPPHEWRVDAMIELMDSPVWGIEQERREGELLGYEDWMNAHFLKLRFPNRNGD